MKLFHLHEAKLDYNPFGELIKGKVQRRIMKGDSRLKGLLTGAGFTMDHVRFAIKNGECLRQPDPNAKSLGPTYLEQTISNVLRDLAKDKQMPLGKFNDARVYFGLERLGVKKLKSPKPKSEVDRKEES